MPKNIDIKGTPANKKDGGSHGPKGPIKREPELEQLRGASSMGDKHSDKSADLECRHLEATEQKAPASFANAPIAPPFKNLDESIASEIIGELEWESSLSSPAPSDTADAILEESLDPPNMPDWIEDYPVQADRINQFRRQLGLPEMAPEERAQKIEEYKSQRRESLDDLNALRRTIGFPELTEEQYVLSSKNHIIESRKATEEAAKAEQRLFARAAVAFSLGPEKKYDVFPISVGGPRSSKEVEAFMEGLVARHRNDAFGRTHGGVIYQVLKDSNDRAKLEFSLRKYLSKGRVDAVVYFNEVFSPTGGTEYQSWFFRFIRNEVGEWGSGSYDAQIALADIFGHRSNEVKIKAVEDQLYHRKFSKAEELSKKFGLSQGDFAQAAKNAMQRHISRVFEPYAKRARETHDASMFSPLFYLDLFTFGSSHLIPPTPEEAIIIASRYGLEWHLKGMMRETREACQPPEV